MQKIYRSRRLPGVFGIVLALPFVAFGAIGMYSVGLESAWFFGMFILIPFVVGILGGSADLSMRINIDERGITQRTLYRVVFAFSWDEVESWKVAPLKCLDAMADDSFTFQRIEFYLRAHKEPTIVYDRNVWRPGFEQFVADIRRLLPNKEKIA